MSTERRSEARHPALSVVVSTLGNYPVLRRVLDGYSQQDAPSGSFELLVVVDQSDPNPRAVDEAIGRRSYPVHRLTGGRPGLSANRNAGWRAARAPVVLFTDNDTIPTPGLTSEHLAWHRRFPEAEVAVLGHVRWARELRVTPFMKWLERGVQFDYPSIAGSDAAWYHLYGANSSIKRTFIEAVGGWDEERLPYGYEDLDWGYRASTRGLRVRYNRRAVVEHIRLDMTLDFWKKRVRRIAAAEHRFVHIHPELSPWFFRMFSDASKAPRVRGRGARLAPFVPPWVPWLGPRVQASAEMAWKQALAPHFLEAWADAEAAQAGFSGLSSLRFSERTSSGSMPGGPK
jgi:GT2 family glycosyltransferase